MKLRTQIILTTLLVLIVASALLGLFVCGAAKRVFMQEMDQRLLSAAQIVIEESQTANRLGLDEQAVWSDVTMRCGWLADRLNVTYLGVLKQKGGGSVPVVPDVKGSGSGAAGRKSFLFFQTSERHLWRRTAFNEMKERQISAVVTGRHVRLISCPFWIEGQPYLSIAGVEMAAVHGVYRKVATTVMGFCVLVLAVAILAYFILVRGISLPVDTLAPDDEGEAGEVPSGADEIRLLTKNVSKMRRAITTMMDRGREAERKLRISEHKHRFLVEHSVDVVWSLDARFRFDAISPSDEKLRGFKPEEVIGTLAWDAVEPKDLRRWRENEAFVAFEREQILQGRSRTYKVHVRRVDGTFMPVEVVATAYIDAEGEVRGYYGTIHDIRDRVRLEEARIKVDRLQNIGTLAAGIAHDFNNILMGLFGNIALAKELLDPKNHAHELLDDAEGSMSRAVRLTKQLLAFSKGGIPQKIDNIDLAGLVSDVAVFDLSGSNVKLQFTKDLGSHVTAIDRGQIEQVVSNLVINARQAMKNGGSIYLSVTHAQICSGEVGQLPAGPYIKVSSRDEGTGIPAAIQRRIFEPYFTTKSTGNGLGLATAHSIVEKHGGALEDHSEEGKGAEFIFYIPVTKCVVPRMLSEAASSGLGRVSPGRASGGVLVMDDEVLICTLLKKALGLEGIRVETVTHAKDAISYYGAALRAGSPYACVILDLTIPGGSGGAEVVQELRKIDPSLFAIASTGYTENEVMMECHNYGFDTIIAKPYSRSDVVDLLRRIGVIRR